MSYVLDDYKFGTGGYGTGATVTWSFATSNFQQAIESFQPYNYTSFLTGQFQTEVRAALAAWEAVANIDFVEVADSTSSMLRFGFVDFFPSHWGSTAENAGPGGIAGQANVFYDNSTLHHVLDADIAFDRTEGWQNVNGEIRVGTNGTRFFSIALHEIGHALGLEHEPTGGERSIMEASLDPSYNGLEATDIAGAQFIYGAKAAQPVAGSVTISDVVIAEGNNGTQVLNFIVNRSGGTAAFDITATTSNSSATTADNDYVGKSQVLSFAAGATQQAFSVVINGDTKVEGNETFNVTLSNATNGATITKSVGVGTINNDDVAAVAGSVTISDVQIVEGNNGTQVANFVVNRSGGTAAFDVTATTSNGSATTADGDYVAKTQVLNFAAGATQQAFSVVINGDTKFEGNETFNVTLSGATNGATISKAVGVGTINNDDAAPAVAGSISIGDVQIVEGNNGTQIANFVVNRSGGTAAFDVTAATSNGSATTADGDYVTKTQVLSFGASVTQQTFSVVINGDTKVEANETFNVTLSGATNGATISKAVGVGTINNDDAAQAVAGSISIGDAQIVEGNSGTKVLNFTVNRSGGTAAFSVDAATAAGSASGAAGDYVAKGATLNFGAGVNSQTFSVTINGDTVVEANETFNVVLSNATNGATISDNTGVGTITNDDTAAPANQAPTVTAYDKSIVMNGSVAASSLFVAHDANGDNTITRYAFWDGGSDGGHFTVNGVEQGSSKWIYVNAGDLGSVRYVGGDAAGNEALYVAAYDGQVWADYDGLLATTTTRQVPMDYNGDGHSDILWQHTNGAITEWLMSGSSFNQAGLIGGGGDPNWRVVSGANDFNADGKADLLWQHNNGAVTLWMMDGDSFSQTGLIGGGGDPNWQIKGAGDFNGDGKADIVWQHSGGAVALWMGQGNGGFTGSDIIGVSGDTNWQIEATGDINGDGKDDILWQRTDNGASAAWMMDGVDIKSSVGLGGGGDPNWDLRTSGDFNGDGKDDILWQHEASGAVAIWQMDGVNAISSDLIGGNGDPNLEIKGTGDFNSDGRADVVFQQHGSGAVFIWEMDGFNFTSSGLLGGGGDPNWQVIAI